MLTLNVSKRTKDNHLEELRKKGFVPAVYYGKKQSSTPISVKEVDFLKAWRQAGESTVVVLKDDEGEHESLIYDVVKDPVSGKVVHADFYILEKGKKVKVKVPIEYIGVSEAVKSLGGVLVKVLHELEIEAKPTDLPHAIEVDISSLVDFESQIHAKDVRLPTGVDLIENPDEVVVLVSMPKEEVEEVVPIDLESIEVEKKGKKEPEAEEDISPEPAA